MRLTIEKAVHGGFGLARERDGGVVLVRGALPGETVEAAVVKRKKDYAVARATAVERPSPRRVAPPCAVHGACGGCGLQHADYALQLEMKADAVADAIRRIAKVATPPPAVRPSEPFRYRHRGRFGADGAGIGFRAEGTHRIVPVRSCPVMVDGINELLPACRGAAALGAVGEVVVACDGERTVAHLPETARDERVAGLLRDGGACGVAFRDGASGTCGLEFRLGRFACRVSPGTFFQANWKANLDLVARVEALAAERPGGRVLDLCAGAGNFTIPLSAAAGEVVAVEESAEAVEDLGRNLADNGIGNVRAVRSRIERFRPSGRFDFVVVDPPRTGLPEGAVGLLRGLRAARVVYVSCDPATLARDLGRFSGAYRLAGVEAYDLFPQTHHVETLAILEPLQ